MRVRKYDSAQAPIMKRPMAAKRSVTEEKCVMASLLQKSEVAVKIKTLPPCRGASHVWQRGLACDRLTEYLDIGFLSVVNISI